MKSKLKISPEVMLNESLMADPSVASPVETASNAPGDNPIKDSMLASETATSAFTL
jgi:hypothetical protein